MLTGEIRSQIDSVWNAFWSGGISNPMEVLEQVTYLLFIRRLDDVHTLEEGKATPDQIEFIDLVVQELTRNGVMDAGRLFESPFTDVNAQGPLGLFPPARVTQLVELLDQIREWTVA